MDKLTAHPMDSRSTTTKPWSLAQNQAAVRSFGVAAGTNSRRSCEHNTLQERTDWQCGPFVAEKAMQGMVREAVVNFPHPELCPESPRMDSSKIAGIDLSSGINRG